jgi:hypothetical protein
MMQIRPNGIVAGRVTSPRAMNGTSHGIVRNSRNLLGNSWPDAGCETSEASRQGRTNEV